MDSNTEEMAGFRQATQFHLAGNRAEMESVIIESTDRIMGGNVLTQEANHWGARAIDLQKEFMDLLGQYLEAGGTVLAAPIYKVDATNLNGPAIRPSRIHLFTKFTRRYGPGEVPLHLQHLLEHTLNGLWVHALAVQNQEGEKIQLKRIIGEPEPYEEDARVWKWVFCELGEGEDVNTVVTDRKRWGWGGKFTWGTPLEIGEQWGVWAVTRWRGGTAGDVVVGPLIQYGDGG